MGANPVIEARAPIRICDIGGWTDTWFGAPGRVLNLAVTPGVEVTIATVAKVRDGGHQVVLDVESFGDRYPIAPGTARVARHRLLEAAVDALPPPADVAVHIRVRSAAPPGCGTGTSAAVAVALVGALALGHPRSPLARSRSVSASLFWPCVKIDGKPHKVTQS